MKIVHVGYGHKYDDIRIFQKECTSLAKAGYDVTYITSDKLGYLDEQSINGVRVKVIKLINKRFIRLRQYQKDLYQTLIAEDADIYHFHEYVLTPVAMKMIKRNKKVIYDLHEDSPRQLRQNLNNKFGKFIGGMGERYIEKSENRLIRESDGVITVVDSIAERLRRVGGKRVFLIANYPILEENDQNISARVKGNQICYCGGVSRIRGISQMIDAMEDVEGTLVLAGPFPNDLQEEVSARKGWEKVDYRGVLPKAQVDRIYSESVVGLCIYLVTPNNVNSNPNKLFEYMNAGMPLVCSDFSLWSEIVEKGECGVCVNPENPKEIAKEVNYLLLNRDVSSQLGENGRKIVREKYNWNVEEKKLFQLYNDVYGEQF